MPSAVLSATGEPFLESLDTTRFDGGLIAQTPLRGRHVMTARLSATRKGEHYRRGALPEHDLQDTLFAELAVRGTARRQTWVGGIAFERSTLDPRDQPQFAYAYNVPGVFAQDDIEVSRWLTISASGRVDVHNQFGTFLSPRISALMRHKSWTTRASVGNGFFAPSALTEETAAAGLARLSIPTALKVERGQSTSLDVTKVQGPVTVTATVFRYDVRDPAVVDRSTYTLASLSEPTITSGIESVATFRRAPFSVTATYTYVHSAEGVGSARGDVPLQGLPPPAWPRGNSGHSVPPRSAIKLIAADDT